MKEYVFKSDRENIPEALDFIKNCLSEGGITRGKAVEPILTAEEILVKICDVSKDGSDVHIEAGGLLSSFTIKYSGKGGEFSIADIQNKFLFNGDNSMGDDADEVMKSLMEKLFGDNLSVKCNKGKIYVKQVVEKSPYAPLIMTVSSLILGIIAGTILHLFIPESVSGMIIGNILAPLEKVIMNAIKLLVGPLVFFSIASSIAEFSDFKALGKIAMRIIVMYMLTSIAAIFIGLLTYHIFPIGQPELMMAVDSDNSMQIVNQAELSDFSIADTLVSIVPTDIVTPFQKADMLEIIFMAVCLGMASAEMSKTAPIVKEFISSMNGVFSRITGAVIRFMPIMIFCSMAKMMANMNFSSFMEVFAIIPDIYLGDVFMIALYMVLLMVFAGLNPLKYISKYYPTMLTAFTTSSSNATLPSSIRQCKKLGISEKIYSFSLPLGASINMDGNCITLIISALFFARIYGIPFSGSMFMQLFISIIVLSIGAPGIPNGNLVCLTLLIPQIGIPPEAISLVVGLYPIISMMQTLTNVTGDAVVTTIVAKRENMMDIKTYNE